MKLTLNSNALLSIQANPNKEGDFSTALKVAERIVQETHIDCVVAEYCDFEQWVLISAVWNEFQAEELRYEYLEAKKYIYNQSIR